jgi:hypothetical protein
MTTYSEFFKDIGLGILLLPIIVSISAVILRWLNKKISKFDIPFSKAFTVELLIGVVGIIISFLIGVIGIWAKRFTIVNLVMLVLFFLSGTPFYAKMLVHPKKGPIGWRKGLVYSIILGALDVLFQLAATFVQIFLLSIIY